MRKPGMRKCIKCGKWTPLITPVLKEYTPICKSCFDKQEKQTTLENLKWL